MFFENHVCFEIIVGEIMVKSSCRLYNLGEGLYEVPSRPVGMHAGRRCSHPLYIYIYIYIYIYTHFIYIYIYMYRVYWKGRCRDWLSMSYYSSCLLSFRGMIYIIITYHLSFRGKMSWSMIWNRLYYILCIICLVLYVYVYTHVCQHLYISIYLCVV